MRLIAVKKGIKQFYFVALSFLTIFTIFAKLGFDHAHIKKVSEGKVLGRCNGTFLATKAGLVVLMVVLTIGSILVWKTILGRGFESPDHELAVYIILIYESARMFALFFSSTYQGKREILLQDMRLENVFWTANLRLLLICLVNSNLQADLLLLMAMI